MIVGWKVDGTGINDGEQRVGGCRFSPRPSQVCPPLIIVLRGFLVGFFFFFFTSSRRPTRGSGVFSVFLLRIPRESQREIRPQSGNRIVARKNY